MMDFDSDWSFFCKEEPQKEVVGLQTYQVGSVSFKMIPIPGQSYSMMETPVTQELYQAVMGEDPSYFKGNPQNPVEDITWDNANDFCANLSSLTGSQFRLPTSEEWLFSALGGLSSFDDSSPITDYGVFGTQSTAPVKSKTPNSFGLYDMLGNVFEWTNSLSESTGPRMVICGGSWCTLRITWIIRDFSPSHHGAGVGFRCVKDLT